MSIHVDWYARNASRDYPFSPDATLFDDTGGFAPESMISDIAVRYPGNDDSGLFISYLEIGDRVTLAINRTSPDTATVATLTMGLGAITEGVPVPLVPILDGVKGFVVFGSVRDIAPRVLRFSGFSQSGIIKSVCTAFQPSTQYRFGYTGTSDLVASLGLIGNGDIQVERGTRTIDGIPRDAIIFSLVGNSNVVGRNALSEYAGRCGQRPESRTCDDPQPIENFAGVTADCCGRVFVELRGCGEIIEIGNHCGIAIDCNTNVDQTCPDSLRMPDDRGRLPNEFNDNCQNSGPTISEQDSNIQDLAADPPADSRIDYRRFI